MYAGRLVWERVWMPRAVESNLNFKILMQGRETKEE